jgi:hypothetical protein
LLVTVTSLIIGQDTKIRKGREIEDSEKIVVLDIKTKCPSKWILIDTETGQSYQGNPNGHWDRLEIKTRKGS